MTKTNRGSSLSWKPVRRGDLYCSSACGAGCTWERHQAALLAADRAKKRMRNPGDWKIVLNENMGWFWKLVHTTGLLTVSGGQLPYQDDPTKDFHASLSSTASGGCDAQFYDERRFDCPQAAVDHRLDFARRRLNDVIRLLETFGQGVQIEIKAAKRKAKR